ncbi:hypothetical protein GCM10009801_07860 [Streptomyces albiaxialis]|uniref:Uncharacterized protein n=1 Tax=Streptomyces albiaxialis TaxID=329523 RepID=A0ABN2VKP7_9ACTN
MSPPPRRTFACSLAEGDESPARRASAPVDSPSYAATVSRTAARLCPSSAASPLSPVPAAERPERPERAERAARSERAGRVGTS